MGFQFKWSIPYYRGVYVSCLSSNISVNVDGVEYPKDKISLKIGERVIPWSKVDQATDIFWPYGTYCTVLVESPGGLEPGLHKVEFGMSVRKSYMDQHVLPQYANLYNWSTAMGGGQGVAQQQGQQAPGGSAGLTKCTKEMVLVM